VLGCAVSERVWCRGAVAEAGLALLAVAAGPLAGGALADLGGRGRLGQRPTVIDDAPGELAALLQTELGVSVELHPVSSLWLVASNTPSLQGGPDEQRAQELHLTRYATQRPRRITRMTSIERASSSTRSAGAPASSLAERP